MLVAYWAVQNILNQDPLKNFKPLLLYCQKDLIQGHIDTVCPVSSDPFYVVTYFIK